MRQVTDDPEILAFWKDVREQGHPDKPEGWFDITDIDSLTEALTTIAWTASAHHAAVNFGAQTAAKYTLCYVNVVCCCVLFMHAMGRKTFKLPNVAACAAKVATSARQYIRQRAKTAHHGIA